MKKNTLIITAIVAMLMFAMTACMNDQQRALKKAVDQYEAQLPDSPADGITITDISYDPSEAVVTLRCNIANRVVAAGVKAAPKLLKSAYVAYLNTLAENEMINAIKAADAKLVCVFSHEGETISQFTILPNEL